MDALLERLRHGPVLWLLHVNADPDCVGSAVALHEAFGGIVGAPGGLSRAGGRLAKRADLAVDEWPHPEKFPTLVAVDTSSRAQLGRLGPKVGDVCLVDHHRYGDLLERAPAAAWDPARGSCCEVALALLDRAGARPSPEAAFALLAGLVDDTKRFRHGDAATLQAAARLVELAGSSVEAAAAFLEVDEEEEGSLPERIATLKSAQRAQVEDVAGFLVATSDVSAYDAAAASALVRAGADLAVVASQKPDRARMSLRASRRLLARGVHLGEVANGAAREVGWSGGGHEAAAGLSGAPPAEPARKAALRLVRAKLEGR